MAVYAEQEITVLIVTEQTLSTYERAVNEVSTATNFFFFCVGSALTIFVAIATTTMTAVMQAIFIALLVAVLLLCVWFVVQIRRAVAARSDAKARLLREKLNKAF